MANNGQYDKSSFLLCNKNYFTITNIITKTQNGSRICATSRMWPFRFRQSYKVKTVNYCHKELGLSYFRNPASASESYNSHKQVQNPHKQIEFFRKNKFYLKLDALQVSFSH